MPVLNPLINELQTDALREVANIGTGHAMTSLAMLTGEDFTMSVPEVGLQALSAFNAAVGDPEALAAAVYMPVGGDSPGHAAFLFPYPSACKLCDMLLGRSSGETVVLDELECSALMEVGNILVSSFLNALSDLTNLNMPASPPGIAIDMSGAILQCLVSASPNLGDHALTIVTRLADCRHPLEGIFVFIPEPASLPILFNALGM